MVSKSIILILSILALAVGGAIILAAIHPYFVLTRPYCPLACVNPNFQDNIFKPNAFFKQRYIDEINPKGTKIISIELEKVNKIIDTDSKLNEIFSWEMHDWHNPNWEPGTFYYFNGSLNYISYKKNATKIRADPDFEYTLFSQENSNGIFFGNDPYWIAYNKVGACQELSNLFSFMARQSGIESRTIQTVGHQWVEVNINGDWKYYDPWCAVEHDYYNSNDGNLTFNTKWYNDTKYFRQNCLNYAYINYNNGLLPNPIIYM